MMHKYFKKALFTVLFLLGAPLLFAQTGTDGTDLGLYLIIGLIVFIALLITLVGVMLLKLLNRVYVEEAKRQAAIKGREYVPEPSFWQRFDRTFTDAVPIEKESEIILDHNYDGIRELDNHLPPWWKYLFYATIVFAFVYIGVYHVFSSMPLQLEEYNMAMAEAEAQKLASEGEGEVIDENTSVFTDDPVALAEGKSAYDKQCVACHAADGGGGVGPNLTDKYWLHGGSYKDIFTTIKYGVPAKGMIAWQSLMSPKQMENVASYIMTLQGTTPAAPKDPQGELYVPEAAEETEALDETTDVATDSAAVVMEEVLEEEGNE